MTPNLKAIFNAVSAAVLAFLIINIVAFCTTIIINGWGGADWSILFKHGAFYVNENLTGLKLGSIAANVVMALFFGISLFNAYQKGKFLKS